MVNFEDLKLGMLIEDNDKHIGKIVKIEDIHNVHIDYYLGLRDEIDYGGYGILCFDPSCDYYESNAKIV